jgi:hypothetical protein
MTPVGTRPASLEAVQEELPSARALRLTVTPAWQPIRDGKIQDMSMYIPSHPSIFRVNNVRVFIFPPPRLTVRVKSQLVQ